MGKNSIVSFVQKHIADTKIADTTVFGNNNNKLFVTLVVQIIALTGILISFVAALIDSW